MSDKPLSPFRQKLADFAAANPPTEDEERWVIQFGYTLPSPLTKYIQHLLSTNDRNGMTFLQRDIYFDEEATEEESTQVEDALVELEHRGY